MWHDVFLTVFAGSYADTPRAESVLIGTLMLVARYLLQAATGEANGYYICYYFGYYA